MLCPHVELFCSFTTLQGWLFWQPVIVLQNLWVSVFTATPASIIKLHPFCVYPLIHIDFLHQSLQPCSKRFPRHLSIIENVVQGSARSAKPFSSIMRISWLRDASKEPMNSECWCIMHVCKHFPSVSAMLKTNTVHRRDVTYMLGRAQELVDWMTVIRWIMTRGDRGIETGYSSLF